MEVRVPVPLGRGGDWGAGLGAGISVLDLHVGPTSEVVRIVHVCVFHQCTVH